MTMDTYHYVSEHLLEALQPMGNSAQGYMREALTDLLTELHEEAGQDHASRAIIKIEQIADDLGIAITHA